MDEQRLSEMACAHAPRRRQADESARCWVCDRPAPCHASLLLDEVRRLERENHLLHLSRGSSALDGDD